MHTSARRANEVPTDELRIRVGDHEAAHGRAGRWDMPGAAPLFDLEAIGRSVSYSSHGGWHVGHGIEKPPKKSQHPSAISF